MASPDRMPPGAPRVEIVVTHSGHIHIHTCNDCTGTKAELIDVLTELIALLERGVDDHGRPISDADLPWPPTASFN